MDVNVSAYISGKGNVDGIVRFNDRGDVEKIYINSAGLRDNQKVDKKMVQDSLVKMAKIMKKDFVDPYEIVDHGLTAVDCDPY